MARRIQRVLPLLMKEEKNKNDYIPKVVSIGPYHHRMPELAPVEYFKPVAINLFVSGGPRDTSFYYTELLGIIGEIRERYGEESTVYYSDDQLALMMLHDACFIINYMEICTLDKAQPPNPLTMHKYFAMVEHLGLLTVSIVLRDMFLLENQIPLRVIKLLMNIRYEAGDYENLLHGYLNISLFGEFRRVLEMEFERAEPLHLLEAFHRLLISDFAKLKKTGCGGYKCWRLCCFKVEQPHTPSDDGTVMAGAAPEITKPCHPSTRRCLCCPRSKSFNIEPGVGPAPTMTSANSKQGLILGLLRTLGCKKAAKNPKNEKVIHSFRSATDLKAKGIHFKPSPTRSLKDVDFKSHLFYATVQLPYWYVSIYTKVFFLNMIAYELSPNNINGVGVASYINFMKSLMERAEDVKELREKKILYNKLGSDQEVLSVYKDINTYGADNPVVFGKVKNKIEAHCKSYTKTWMAELIHTYFRTPWTVIAFLAAISLLAISAAQLQYAVHPN